MVKKLSEKKFLETFKYSPRVALNILVKNKKGEILLTKRAIKPQKGYWHYPGGFILKGERIDDCFKRISKTELGITLDPKKKKSLGVIENLKGDERGHILDLIYEYNIDDNLDLKSNTQTMEFEYFYKLPPKIGFNHKKTLHELGYL